MTPRLLSAAALLAAASPLAAQEVATPPVIERSAADGERLSPGDAAARYAGRIAAIDDAGPMLNSVIVYDANPRDGADAINGASLLAGRTVLVKDNIETSEWATTAGSLALIGNKTGRDAPLIANLRRNGGFVLGKTNLSEWANIRDNDSTSGWSAVGGLTRNPHAIDRNACGSSSGSGAAVAAGLAWAAIGTETGLPVTRLKMVRPYRIDLGFDLASGRDTARPARAHPAPGPVRLTAAERRLVVALADGLPFDPQPYARLGEAAALPETGVMATLRDWLERGVVRRFGAVARHRSLGFEANAMVVWDVPDAQAPAAGGRLAGDAAVTLCYRRARSLPEWPYNLYCMVHGRARDTVLGQVAQLTRLAGLEARPREILFSERCFTQRGARYAAAA